MTIRGLLLGALLALFLAPAAPAIAQDREVDLDVFYQELEPYGRWIDHPRWGSAWRPDVPADWRPYSQGYWVYTEEHGWYWNAEEPWGWATFHYGRWVLDEDDGWIWIPGEEWAPAWVTWRYSDEYVGWAPLPPDSGWGPDDTLIYDDRFYDEPRYAHVWNFVRPHYMTAPGLYRFLLPRSQNFYVVRQARHAPRFRRHDRRVFNPGFDVRHYERLVGRPAPHARLRAVDTPREHHARRGPVGGEIPVFRPRISGRANDANRGPVRLDPGVVPPSRRGTVPQPYQQDPRPYSGPQPRPPQGYTRHTPDQPPQGAPPTFRQAPSQPGQYQAPPPQEYRPPPTGRSRQPPPGPPPQAAPQPLPPATGRSRAQQPPPGPSPAPKAPPPAAAAKAPPPPKGPPPAAKAPPKKEEKKGAGQPPQ